MSEKLINTLARLLKLLIIVFSISSLLLFFYQSIRNHNYLGGNDLTSYLNSSRLFYNGENPFTSGARPYIYPLFLSVVVYPLSLLQSGYLQKTFAAAIWSLISYFAIFMTIISSWRFLQRLKSYLQTIREIMLPVALLILMIHPFLQDEFLNGQANLIVLGGIGGFFFMLQKDRRLWAALVLAVAASIKIAPVLCLVYALFKRQYSAIFAFFLFVFLFNLGIPYLINHQSLQYYGHFISEILPRISTHEAQSGFRSFSIVSTIGHLFSIDWPTPAKLGLTCLCLVGLLIPPLTIAHRAVTKHDRYFNYTFFATIICIIPLTFPMSEAHHLLILTIPFIAILAYWKNIITTRKVFWHDGLSLLFLFSIIILNLGHAFKHIPLRLPALLGIYVGMNICLWRLKDRAKPRQD